MITESYKKEQRDKNIFLSKIVEAIIEWPLVPIKWATRKEFEEMYPDKSKG